MTEPVHPGALAGARLGVDMRMSRAAIRARLFGGEAQPTRLGRFVVVERVGAGGMGIVYAAYDPQLDRRVALKVLRNDAVVGRRSRHQRRLLEEARSMAKLSAVNVVTVFEVGTVDDQVFVAMEYVDAPTLREWVERATPTPGQVLAKLRAAGRGLVAAHDAGLVHRDFKPENVMVPADGPVVVTDFGLAIGVTDDPPSGDGAGLVPATVSGATTLTRELAGTPAYMAPEQLARNESSPASDQYSFCVTLYEALVGRRPYEDAIVRVWAETGGGQLADPSPAAIPESVDVSARVARALERGLSIDPQRRHPSMRALLAELEPRRHRRASWLGFAAVALGGVGVGVAVLGDERPCPRRDERLAGIWDDDVRQRGRSAFEASGLPFAARAWERVSVALDDYSAAWIDAHRDACLASHRGEQSDERLDRRMRCLDARLADLQATSTVLVEADEDVVHNAMRVVAGLGPQDACDDPTARSLAEMSALETAPEALAAGVRETLAHLRAGHFEQAQARAREAVDAAEGAGHDAVLAHAALALARSERALGHVELAQEAVDRAVALAGSTRQFELVARAAIERAELTGVDGGDSDAGLTLAAAAGIAVASAGSPASVTSSLELLMGRLLYADGRFDEGLAHSDRGLAILEDDATPTKVTLADALQLQGTLLYAKGRLDDALHYTERAHALRVDVFGEDHPAVADSLSNLGALSLARGEAARGVELFSQAVRLLERALGPDHVVTAKTLANLASAKLASGDYEGAQQGYTEALRRMKLQVAEDDPRLIAISTNLGGAQFELGRVDAAIETFTRVRRLQEAILGPEHPQLAVTLSNLARARLEHGETDAARDLIRRALEIRRAKLGETHVVTVRNRLDLAAVLIVAGDLDDAIDVLGPPPEDEEILAEWSLWSGIVDLRRKEPELARGHLQTTVALREAASAPASELAAARFLLAHALVGIGEIEEGRALAEEVAPMIGSGRPPNELREFCEGRCDDELEALGVRSSP